MFRIKFPTKNSLVACVVCIKWLKNNIIVKKGVVSWDLEGLMSSLFSSLLTHLFHEHLHRVSASYSMLSQSLVTLTSQARLFINPEFCQCPLRLSCQLQLF